MAEKHLKPKHKASIPKEPEPNFIYDPEKDKQNFSSSQKTELAHELDPLDKDDQLLDPKLERRAKRRKRVKRFFLIFIALLLLTSGGVLAYLYTRAGKISTNPFNFAQKLKGEDEGRVNFLLLGVGDPGHDGDTLADTNMVVSLDTKNNKAALISIPRDTKVYIPGEGYHKINNAHALGELKKPPQGIDLAKRTVEETLDLPIHYYVRANFSGLRQAVDAVGGIDIEVKEALNDPEYPCDKNQYRSCGFKIAAGTQHMDGSTALKYARCRKGNCGDDFGRALRQQQVLQAVREKATSISTLSDPGKLSALIETAANNIKTDMSLSEMQRAYDLSKKISKENTIDVVFSIKSNGFLKQDNASSDLLPTAGNFDEIQRFVKDVFTVGPIWAEDSKVVLQNGTATVGLAGKLQAKIVNAGIPIQILSIQNAKTKDFTTSQIIDYSGGKKPNTVRYFEELLGVKATQPENPKLRPGIQDIDIILGADYGEKIKETGITPVE